jgi:hypothetical protein
MFIPTPSRPVFAGTVLFIQAFAAVPAFAMDPASLGEQLSIAAAAIPDAVPPLGAQLSTAAALAPDYAVPLDGSVLGAITTFVDRNLVTLSFLPGQSDRPSSFLTTAGGSDGRPDESLGKRQDHVQIVLPSGTNTMSLGETDGHGNVSQITQTATIDQPRAPNSQEAMGVLLQSAVNDFPRGSQAATNMAFTLSMEGGNFTIVRP